MPLTEPQNRPGTHLSPLDRLCSREHAAPDKAGEAWGMVWAAWRQFPSDSDRYGKIKVYIADAETGELIKGLETYAYDRQRTRDYHTVESWDELHERLWRMYWTQLYDGTHPLTGLQEYIRRQTNVKAKRQSYEQWRERQRATWRVETEPHPNGGTMNWIQ
jgi:hypothetical protein